MSTHFRKFFIVNTIATIVLLILGVVLFITQFSKYYHSFYIILLIITYVINLTVFYIVTKDAGRIDNSLQIVAKSFAIKFFSYLILALVFLLLAKTPEIKITFVIILFGLYIIFTIIEISSLVKFFKTE